MRSNRLGRVMAVVGVAMAMPAMGQPMMMPTCAAPVAATGALSAWNTPVALPAAADLSHSAQATIAAGEAARVALLPTPDVHYSLRPEKPGGSVSYGGLLAFDIVKAGMYRVALGSGAWIDVVSSGKAMVAGAHDHGPTCTGVRKMVDFSLAAGHYILQISANGEAQTEVLVVPIA